jgi:hypothetical protein
MFLLIAEDFPVSLIQVNAFIELLTGGCGLANKGYLAIMPNTCFYITV